MNTQLVQNITKLNITKEERSTLVELINQAVQQGYNTGFEDARDLAFGEKPTVAYDTTIETE